MADRIKGITIELDGDTTKLSTALRGVNKEIRDTQSNLKDVNKLLKMDPGNADLLAQKQKYLTDAIDATKKKLQEEKLALEQIKNGPQTEETKRQQEALTREIEATTQSLQGLESEYKSFGSVASQQLQTAGAKMQEVGGKISSVGEGMTKNVTVPVVAAGAASVAAWKEVDQALDTVTVKTGASGKALEAMQQSAKNIANSIPTDFQTAGEAIGEVNTRFGLTGKELESLSTKFVQFATLNETDVSTSVDNVSSVLNAFGMDAKDAGGMLDVLNSVGQSTGLSMDTLATDLSQNAAQLKDMGLNATQSAQFLGNVEMSGMDVSVAMAGMKKAMKSAASDGISLDEALKGFTDTMKGNGTETEKLQAAYDLFGTKAGAAIYNAMQTGKLSFDGFSSSMTDFAGNVENTFNETLDPMDQMTVVMNNLKDVGAQLVDAAGPILVDVLTTLKDVVVGLKEAWEGLSPGMQQAIIKVALIAAAVGPVLVVIGKVITAVGTITSAVGAFSGFMTATAIPAISAVLPAILPILPIIAGVVAAIAAVILIVKNWGAISEWFKGVWDAVCKGVQAIGQSLATFFSGLWAGIKSAIETAWNGISTFFSTIWTGISTTASTIWNGVKNFFGGLWEGIKSAASTAWEGIKIGLSTAWEGIKGNASTTFETIKTNIGTAWDNVKTATSEKWESIKSSINEKGGGIKGVISTALEEYKKLWSGAFDLINKMTGGKLGDALTSAKGKLDEIKSAFSGAMNNAKDVVSKALSSIKGFFSNCKLEFPKIKLPHFSISGSFSLDPPSVPSINVSWYRKAMDDAYILNNPTLFGMAGGRFLGGGEAGPEAIVGTDKLAEIVQGAMAGMGGGTTVIPVYIGQDRIDEIVVKANQRNQFRSGRR